VCRDRRRVLVLLRMLQQHLQPERKHLQVNAAGTRTAPTRCPFLATC
jgi:hypothetical protein